MRRSWAVGSTASLTVLSLVALALGLGLGALGHGSTAVWFTILTEIFTPSGSLRSAGRSFDGLGKRHCHSERA